MYKFLPDDGEAQKQVFKHFSSVAMGIKVQYALFVLLSVNFPIPDHRSCSPITKFAHPILSSGRTRWRSTLVGTVQRDVTPFQGGEIAPTWVGG